MRDKVVMWKLASAAGQEHWVILLCSSTPQTQSFSSLIIPEYPSNSCAALDIRIISEFREENTRLSTLSYSWKLGFF